VNLPSPPQGLVDDLVRAALAEDLGTAGDVTSSAVIPASAFARGEIVSRASGTVAGLGIALRTFTLQDPVEPHVADGDRVAPGAALARVAGRAQSLLAAERTALNLLGHLSGIATATMLLVDAVAHTEAAVVDTRKTTPGLRALEKYAVRAGGGGNHRHGLHDAVLIKDNHIGAGGGVAATVKAARSATGHMVKIEVEIETLQELEEALGAGADIVLLDNMTPDELAAAVRAADGRCLLEASGGITPDSIVAVAESGVDLISVGWITHSAPRLDVALEFDG
jgi:nicotinate-nucleotide pyrophosphorylase (carboxylating)